MHHPNIYIIYTTHAYMPLTGYKKHTANDRFRRQKYK